MHSSPTGLSEEEARVRLARYGLNVIVAPKTTFFVILFRQITGNPLTIILAAATLLSYFLGQHISAYYIFGIIVASIGFGFWNEYAAERTIKNLLKKITATTVVIRSGKKQEVPASHITIGDLVLLSPGSIIPADLRLIEVSQLEMDESALTGESKTVFKTLGKDTSTVFMGTSVASGSGTGEVVKIGKDTEFGKIAKSTTFIKPETEFQKGLAQFGKLIVNVIIVLTIAIFAIDAFVGHAVLESILFALAIAVGLTPELLPVIVTVSLSHGAGKLAKKHVVVKRLLSLENFGNMDILCTDKTGTLTEGKINVVAYNDMKDQKNPTVLDASLLCNSAIHGHKVIGNAIDVALWEYAHANKINPDTAHKLHEEPFDYEKKAMYVVVKENKQTMLIAKGAPEAILALCGKQEANDFSKKLASLRNDGYRVIAIAQKKIAEKGKYTWDDARGLTPLGYISFLDIPKKSAKEALEKLARLNVAVKIVTGDNDIIARKICQEVGMKVNNMLTGEQIDKLSDEALRTQAAETDIFAMVSPLQKLRIIKSLQSKDHTIGYLGDGINDLPALHNADVGISVNTAVDVAKDAASVVLLQKGLDVIADGIIEGRKTFSNTIKYVLMSTSSNFGNMFSAAGASFFLPFLPMTAVQILLTNGLYDISQTTIPSDNVDEESLVRPRHWDIGFIRNYMLFFGPLSSVFDFLTFAIMLFVFHAQGKLFQTGWFVESLATEILVIFVIRTARTPFFKSRPSIALTLTSLGIVGLGLALPYMPFARNIGFVPLPSLYFFILIVLVTTYLILVELVKNSFLKRYHL